ncbi:MAG: threonine synthase, partial [Caldiserica bacterium CG02_land_8_20_14_3_00_36_38]
TGFAGFVKSIRQGIISKNDKVVVLITGNGLKDVESAIRAGGEPLIIDPNIDAVKKALKND